MLNSVINMGKENETPLILVCYLDREVMGNDDIREIFINSIQSYIDGYNILTFFLPTDDTERIECINPKYIDDKSKIEEIDKLILDIKTKFQIGN